MDEMYKEVIIDLMDYYSDYSAYVIVISFVIVFIYHYRSWVCSKLGSKRPINSNPLLPPSPKHKIQNRSKVVEAIHSKFDELCERCPDHDAVVTVYLEGPPGFGKTQAARLFANEFYNHHVSDYYCCFYW